MVYQRTPPVDPPPSDRVHLRIAGTEAEEQPVRELTEQEIDAEYRAFLKTHEKIALMAQNAQQALKTLYAFAISLSQSGEPIHVDLEALRPQLIKHGIDNEETVVNPVALTLIGATGSYVQQGTPTFDEDNNPVHIDTLIEQNPDEVVVEIQGLETCGDPGKFVANVINTSREFDQRIRNFIASQHPREYWG